MKNSSPSIHALPNILKSEHLIKQSKSYITEKLLNRPINLERYSEKLQTEIGKLEIRKEGVALSVAQERLMNTIYEFLDKYGSIRIDGIQGNCTSRLKDYQGIKVPPVCLTVRQADLFREYLGSSKYSGKEAKNIALTLRELCEIQFLIQYSNSGQPERKCATLLKRLSLSELSPREGDIHSKFDCVLALNPILTDRLYEDFVHVPFRLNRKTILAAGGKHKSVSECTLRLRDTLLNEFENGSVAGFNFRISNFNLINALNLKLYYDQSRHSLIRQSVTRAAETSVALGIISKYSISSLKDLYGESTFVLSDAFIFAPGPFKRK